MKKYDLITLGEVLLRLSPALNERIAKASQLNMQIGGAELNVASAVSQLGLSTAIISKLPNNDLGTFAKNNIKYCGVNEELISFDNLSNARLGTYFFESGAYPRKPGTIYDRQNSSFNQISIYDFNKEIFSSTKIFHTTGITLALSSQARETAIEIIKLFKENGALISFDVNYRASLWTEEEARKCITQILPYIDIFFCSYDTAKLTFKKNGTLKEIMKEFCDEYKISIMASTKRTVHSPKLHSFTSTIYNSKENKYYEEEPYNNIDVIDRIGSGDAYIAGALYGLLKYNFNCQKALLYGNATSAIKNTITGDMLCSDINEIDNIIKEHTSLDYHSEMKR